MFDKEQTLDLRVLGKNSSNEKNVDFSVFGDILMLLA